MNNIFRMQKDNKAIDNLTLPIINCTKCENSNCFDYITNKDNNLKSNQTKSQYDLKPKSQIDLAKVIMLNIALGQLLAVLSVSNGLFSQQLETKYAFVTPLLLTSSYYALLGIIWILINRSIHKPKLSYLLITIVDSQANFINVYAFSIIHFEYPFIINFCSVIWTSIFTWIFIKKYKYFINHILGICIAFFGVILTVVGTFNSFTDFEKLFSSNWIGIVCCVSTSILYAINGILQEIFLTTEDEIKNFFPWISIIGCPLTFIESFAFNEIGLIGVKYIFQWEVGGYWIAFAISLTIITTISPYFIQKCSASMFNLSLAATIFWSYIANFIIGSNNTGRSAFYFIGFVVIIVGLIIYYSKEVKMITQEDHNNNKDINKEVA